MHKFLHTAGHATEEQGFSLIEMLVVSALLAMMAAILYGTLSGLMRGREEVSKERELTQTAQYVLEQIQHDLTSSRDDIPLGVDEQSSTGTNPQPTPTPGGFSGFGTNTPRHIFQASDDGEGEGATDSMRFVSNRLPQLDGGANPLYGAVEVTFLLEEPDSQRQGLRHKEYALVREETPAGVNAKIRDKLRRKTVVASGVTGLNFRYQKKGEWLDTWSKNEIGLPEAVEIRLSLSTGYDGREHGEESFTTAVFLRERRTATGVQN